mmetsp:Transcript_26374/g.41555  ORF Transcript_26374/g.41555 Transcript_26374/m.41555 type:complete len:346 (-) Transcript_26374:746-1783(-)
MKNEKKSLTIVVANLVFWRMTKKKTRRPSTTLPYYYTTNPQNKPPPAPSSSSYHSPGGLRCLQIDGADEEHKVQGPHDGPQGHVQPPLAQHDGGDDGEDHDEQQGGVHHQVGGLHGDDLPRTVHGRVDEPGDRQAHEDVEDVGPDGTGDGHVPLAHAGHDHRAEGVRDGRACRQDGQAHHHVAPAQHLAHDGAPPHQQVAEQRDPDQRGAEGQQEVPLPARRGAVRDGEVQRQHQRQRRRPQRPLLRPLRDVERVVRLLLVLLFPLRRRPGGAALLRGRRRRRRRRSPPPARTRGSALPAAAGPGRPRTPPARPRRPRQAWARRSGSAGWAARRARCRAAGRRRR